MGDPLRELEERLERLAPQGLSDQGKVRLHQQIDELAARVERPGRHRVWQRIAGIAAGLVLVAAVVVVSQGVGRDDAGAAKGVPVSAMTDMEVVEHYRAVGEAPEDRGIVLTRNNEPMHSWGYSVKKIELVYDPETGRFVHVVTEVQKEVLTAVTSF